MTMTNPYFNLIKSVWQNGQPWHKTIVGYYIAFTLSQLFLSLSPYAFGRTINILQDFTPDKLPQVILWMSASIIVLLLFWLLHGPARVQERSVALKIQQAFRIRLYEQLTQLPLKWHQDHHSGNIITRVNRASAALFRFAGEQFIFIQAITKFILSIGFLLWISLPVGLLSLATCVVAWFTVLAFDRKLIPLYDGQNEIENHVGAVFFDYVSNMTTILTLRLGNLTRTNLFQRMMTAWPFYRKDCLLNEAKWFSMNVLLFTVQSLILITYIIYHLKTTDSILIGTVVMIYRYQIELTDVFFNLSMFYSELVRMNTDMKSLQPILNDVAQLSHAPEGEAVARQWHTLAINNLVFSHAPDQEQSHSGNTFENLSLTIKRGENIALIGSSGGGKSTLLNLLRGLYQAEHVQLTIDDISFDALEALQSITTLIPQDPEVFENTILFNITMDVPAKPEAIESAITLAGFNQVLTTLPKGLATDIRERGLNLSVGQKQRLALARGLFAARFSSLILIDEPTSSVDLPTEKEILSGVLNAFPDASIVVSLHRLHLLPKFDRIIMLKDGKIIADGATTDLLNNPGPVRDLWQSYQE